MDRVSILKHDTISFIKKEVVPHGIAFICGAVLCFVVFAFKKIDSLLKHAKELIKQVNNREEFFKKQNHEIESIKVKINALNQKMSPLSRLKDATISAVIFSNMKNVENMNNRLKVLETDVKQYQEELNKFIDLQNSMKAENVENINKLRDDLKTINSRMFDIQKTLIKHHFTH